MGLWDCTVASSYFPETSGIVLLDDDLGPYVYSPLDTTLSSVEQPMRCCYTNAAPPLSWRLQANPKFRGLHSYSENRILGSVIAMVV